MPELPEVETIARNLRQGGDDIPSLVGQRICAVRLFWERALYKPSPTEFIQQIIGQSILAIGRRAKFLVFSLSTDTLLIHLRMSGDLLLRPVAAPLLTHDRLVLDLTSGFSLIFNDPRKFGRLWLTSHPEKILGKLGPEPFDESLTAADFYQRLHATRRQIKPLLMDQNFLAGMGNIYTDEALHLAGIHPLARSDSLSLAQAERLLDSIRQVLQDGIRRNGASIDWVYRGGDFQNYFRVYQRTGAPCPVCGTPVERIVIGQRGTHYCPACQKID
ncbi:MAG: bifunctional DNA-formamidopyrimidine glycosylase/DNA-(apurinic or apyrimidinic site) lyase [Anaerolineales bacterium]|nr:bifunctional DNA-formamidopyrimidine glycosylase/DNA-(apurinic or apyrimidinic site) lyase [Anaerolineales bacterium]